MEDAILTKRDGPIVHITLNRPNDGNRVTDEMLKRLTSLIEGVGPNDNLILFTGAGANFCLGREIELREPTAEERAAFAQMPPYVQRALSFAPAADPRRNNQFTKGDANRLAVEFYETVQKCPIPIGAAVSGVAGGFGCALAIICDIVLADDEAEFRVTDPDPNFSNSLVMPALLERLPDSWITRKESTYLAYSRNCIDAKSALEMGLVSSVVPGGKLQSEIEMLSMTLSNETAEEVRAMKRFVRKAAEDAAKRGASRADLALRAAGFAAGWVIGDTISDAISGD